MGDHLALHRHPAGQHEDQPAQRVDLVLFFVGKAQADHGLDILQRGAGLNQPLAGLFLDGDAALDLVMLVLDLADDLLDQVLDGDQPIHAAIFVDHHRHMDALLLHLLQQNADRHRGRHVKQRPQHRPQRELDRGFRAKAIFQRQILEVDHAQRAVHRVAKHRHPGKAMLAEHLDQFRQGGTDRSGHDLGLGHRHVIDPHPPQVQQPRRTHRAGCGPVAALARIAFVTARERTQNAPQKAA